MRNLLTDLKYRHVHSVLGAFGLNSSIYDAANLSWKLGLCARGAADPEALLPTYDAERRLFANRVIRCSGAYLRFICNMPDLPLAELRGLSGDALEAHEENLPLLDGSIAADRRWLADFFGRNAMFLLGVDGARVPTLLSPDDSLADTNGTNGYANGKVNGNKMDGNGVHRTNRNGVRRVNGNGVNGNGVHENGVNGNGHGCSAPRPISVLNGVRAPDPRVCFQNDYTGHLYDAMSGVDKFHVLVFGSDLNGPARRRLAEFSRRALAPGSGFYARFGGQQRFNIVLVTKLLPHEADEALQGPDLENLRSLATVAYDDRQPDDDAHYWYGVNHARGAAVVVRPDLVVGMSAWPEDTGAISDYLSGFLFEVETNGYHY